MLKVKYFIIVGGVAAMVAATGLSGCSSKEKEARESGRTTAQVSNDNQISENVAKSLKNSPVYKYPDVDVTTFNRVVQLNGFVATDDQKSMAEQVAKNTPGVDKVINNITVHGEPPLMPTGR
jgi:osmotically-inducible protein OsmY